MNTSAQTAVKQERVNPENTKQSSCNCQEFEYCFSPDLSHHYCAMGLFPRALDLFETIDEKTNTGIALTSLLSTRFVSEEHHGLSGDSVLSVVTAIELVIMDSIAIIKDFHDLSRHSDDCREELRDSERALPLPDWIYPAGISVLTSVVMEATNQRSNRARSALDILNTTYENIEGKDISNKVIHAALEATIEELRLIKAAAYEFSELLKL